MQTVGIVCTTTVYGMQSTWGSTGCADSGWHLSSGHRAGSAWCSSPSRGNSPRHQPYCSTWPPLNTGKWFDRFDKYQHVLSLFFAQAVLIIQMVFSLIIRIQIFLYHFNKEKKGNTQSRSTKFTKREVFYYLFSVSDWTHDFLYFHAYI